MILSYPKAINMTIHSFSLPCSQDYYNFCILSQCWLKTKSNVIFLNEKVTNKCISQVSLGYILLYKPRNNMYFMFWVFLFPPQIKCFLVHCCLFTDNEVILFYDFNL